MRARSPAYSRLQDILSAVSMVQGSSGGQTNFGLKAINENPSSISV